MNRIVAGLGLVLLGLIPGEPPRPVTADLTGDPWAIPTGRLARPVPEIHRALIISIDGLRPDVLLRANAPNIRHLFQNGSFSFWARTTAMSVTLPSHTSMLTGVSPDRHGISWNDNEPVHPGVYPSVPTLFELAHRAGYTTAMVAGKAKFANLNKPGTLDWASIPTLPVITDGEVATTAVGMIHSYRPQVMFVHLGWTDAAGHRFGWGTPQQIDAVERADAVTGRLLAALAEEKLLDATFILISSDHGGQGRAHGPDDVRSRHIPWIAFGPGIRKNMDLTVYPRRTIETEDTCATVCWLLGIPTAAKYLQGKPIHEIIEQRELLHVVSAPR